MPDAEDQQHCDKDVLILAFARLAATEGWTEKTLTCFCREHGITATEQGQYWPNGIRSLGHGLNIYADAHTQADFQQKGKQPLSLILRRRFEQNEPFKLSVLSLARSDLWHPVDTFRRTWKTASLFWQVQDRPISGATLWQNLKTGLLVILYSLCVLIWLSDKPPYRRLGAWVQVTARILGAR